MHLLEKLKVSDGIGAWIKDFQKSDAPQFKGKSDKERRDQAIAAYLSAKNGDKNESSLPPHLQIFNKSGHVDPKKVSQKVHQGKKPPQKLNKPKFTVTDVTPKGYGPKEETQNEATWSDGTPRHTANQDFDKALHTAKKQKAYVMGVAHMRKHFVKTKTPPTSPLVKTAKIHLMKHYGSLKDHVDHTLNEYGLPPSAAKGAKAHTKPAPKKTAKLSDIMKSMTVKKGKHAGWMTDSYNDKGSGDAAGDADGHSYYDYKTKKVVFKPNKPKKENKMSTEEYKDAPFKGSYTKNPKPITFKQARDKVKKLAKKGMNSEAKVEIDHTGEHDPLLKKHNVKLKPIKDHPHPYAHHVIGTKKNVQNYIKGSYKRSGLDHSDAHNDHPDLFGKKK